MNLLMNPALLLLTDSRLPAGGHAHSGGAERAIVSGAVHDLETMARFLKGRLHTTGLVAASFAATACALPSAQQEEWVLLDGELDARTPSPAQREASRTQGRLLLRVARRLWPSTKPDALGGPAGAVPRSPDTLGGLAGAVPSPHHPIALGAVAHVAGLSPEDAALAAAYHAITGPATAAVRLLGLDPVEVHRVLAALIPDLATTAAKASTASAPEGLPTHSAPALDLLAESHARAQVRLFIS